MALTETIRLLINAEGNVDPIKRSAAELKNLDKAFRDAGLSSKQSATMIGQWDKQTAAAGQNVKKGLGQSLTDVGRQFGVTMPMVLATGGAAIGAFAVKAVASFQEGALAAAKLSESTGMAVEDASRWNEVAGDLGVSSDTLGRTFGFLLKSIGKTPETFRALGITAKDANGQILQAIDLLNRTPEGAERAALAAKLFGRSWQEVSELVAMGATDVKAALESVGDAQVFTEAEVAKARSFRDALNELSDTVARVGDSLANSLVPALTALANAANSVLGPLLDLQEKVSSLGPAFQALPLAQMINPFERVKFLAEGATTAVNQLSDGIGMQGPIMEKLSTGMGLTNAQLQQLGINTTAAGTAFAGSTVNAMEHALGLDQVAVSANAVALAEQASNAQSQQAAALVAGLTAQYQAAKAAVDNYAMSVLALSNSELALSNATLAVENALAAEAQAASAAASATDDTSTATNEADAASRAYRGAVNATQGAINAYAAQAVQTAAAQRGLSVEQLSGAEKANIMRGALQSLAAANPPLQGQIQGTINKLNAIPPEKHTTLSVQDNAAGAIGAHISRLNMIPSTKTTTLVVSHRTNGGEAIASATGGPVSAPTGMALHGIGRTHNVGDGGQPEAVQFGAGTGAIFPRTGRGKGSDRMVVVELDGAVLLKAIAKAERNRR